MDKFLSPVRSFADSCEGGSFFSLPTWYKYLPCESDNSTIANFELNHIWLILLAVLDMLMLVVGIAAVAYFIYSGFIMMTSQGNPEKVASARNGMVSATVGMILAISAAGIVRLVSGVLG